MFEDLPPDPKNYIPRHLAGLSISEGGTGHAGLLSRVLCLVCRWGPGPIYVVTACALIATALWCADAKAGERFDLTWNATPESCPPASVVEAEIERSLARVQSKSHVVVRADVAAVENEAARAEEIELHVRVEHAGEVGERTIPAATCDEAVRATALFVALAVDFRPEPAREEPRPQPKPRVPSRPWLLAVGPHIASGLVPEISGGVGLALGFAGSWWRGELRASGFAPTQKSISGTLAGGQYQLMSVGVLACGGSRFDTLGLFGCLGGRAARVGATGHGASSNRSEESYLGVGVVGLDLEWHFASPFLLRLGGEAGYSPRTSRFVIENIGLAHETGNVTGEARLELGVTF